MLARKIFSRTAVRVVLGFVLGIVSLSWMGGMGQDVWAAPATVGSGPLPTNISQGNWNDVGGTDGEVRALAKESYYVFGAEYSRVYVGGNFSQAGSMSSVGHVASWENGQWGRLGFGVDGPVNAVAVASDGTVYVGGDFDNYRYLCGGFPPVICTSPANNLAKWDDGVWSTVGYSSSAQGVNGPVLALAIDSADQVYVGGSFTGACLNVDCTSISRANNVIKYNHPGGSWSSLMDNGVNSVVRALAIDEQDKVYLGGSFSSGCATTDCSSPAGTLRSVAMWSQNNLVAMDYGLQGYSYDVTSLFVASDGSVYAGGDFDRICQDLACSSTTATSKVAQWDGSSWSRVGSNSFNTMWALEEDNTGAIFAGGDNLFRWDGANWSTVGVVNNEVKAMVVDSHANLYAGGTISSIGATDYDHIAQLVVGDGVCGLAGGGAHSVYSRNQIVTIDIQEAGTLECLSVQRHDRDYQGGEIENLKTGHFWEMGAWDGTGAVATGYEVTLSFSWPSDRRPDYTDKICYDTGSVWDCALSAYTSYNMRRSGITDVNRNWFIGDGVTAAGEALAPGFVNLWGEAGTGVGQFDNPYDIVRDNQGNVYVTDKATNRVIKFNENGAELWTVGGTGSGNGFFVDIAGIGVDKNNNVYVADRGNSRIQKFSVGGSYITQWSAGGASGNLQQPEDVAVDGSGNVYVTDSADNGGVRYIRKYSANGTILDWVSLSGGEIPMGIDVDRDGRVWVTDTGLDKLWTFDHFLTNIRGVGGSGTGAGLFDNPMGVATDAAGNVYVADTGNHRIQKFTNRGNYIDSWGRVGSGPNQFNGPTGVAVDSAGMYERVGDIFVVDSNNDKIHRYSDYVVKQCGVRPTAMSGVGLAQMMNGNSWSDVGYRSASLHPMSFQNPVGVEMDASRQNVYTLSRWSNDYHHVVGGPGYEVIYDYTVANNADLEIIDFAVDREGNIFFLEQDNGVLPIQYRAKKFNPQGVLEATWGGTGSAVGQFDSPTGIAVDYVGNVYVADWLNDRVQRFDNNGNNPIAFGTQGTGNGQFYGITDLDVGLDGYLYTLENGNNRVQRFTSTGGFVSSFYVANSADRLTIDADNRAIISFLGSVVRVYDGSGTLLSSQNYVSTVLDIAAGLDDELYVLSQPVVNDGDLRRYKAGGCMLASWSPESHPQATVVQETGQHWYLEATDVVTATVRLPHEGITSAEACYYDVATAAWQCGLSARSTSNVWWETTAFGPWTVSGSCVEPDVPSITSVTSTSSSVTITWAADNNDQYEIWRSTNPYDRPGLGATELVGLATGTSYTDSDLGNGLYFYHVVGLNGCGGNSATAAAEIGSFQYDLIPGG
ncbi:MAG TPA: 6-bladed beta-propeller [Anaerolineae bacterium]|nr:6-bladed beta-propeller [Anaerolineae bacterium]